MNIFLFIFSCKENWIMPSPTKFSLTNVSLYLLCAHLQNYALRLTFGTFDSVEVNFPSCYLFTYHSQPYTQSQRIQWTNLLKFSNKFTHNWLFTYLLNIQRANDVAKYGSIMCKENSCSGRLLRSWNISIKLNTMIERAIINDWPASSPLMPARMFIALVQKTANIPMYK